MAILRGLASWREQAARTRNIPRGWVVRDEALAEIAQHLPKDATALARVRGLKDSVARGRDGRAILEAVADAQALPEGEWPALKGSRAPTGPGQDSLVALLQALLRLRADAHGVSGAMIAKRDDIERLASEDEPDVEALRGWRRKVYGEGALELKAGRLALTGVGDGVREVVVG